MFSKTVCKENTSYHFGLFISHLSSPYHWSPCHRITLSPYHLIALVDALVEVRRVIAGYFDLIGCIQEGRLHMNQSLNLSPNVVLIAAITAFITCKRHN